MNTDRAAPPQPEAPSLRDRLLHTLRGIWAREPWWAEFWAGVGTILWSIWPFLSGGDMQDRPSWFVASLLLDARYWQYGGIMLGTAKIFILLQDSPYVRWLRLMSCFLGAWFWSFLATSLLMVDSGAPSVALYVTPVLVNLYSMIRLQPTARLKWAR